MHFQASHHAVTGLGRPRLFALGAAATVLLGPGVAFADIMPPSPWDDPLLALVACIAIAGLMTLAIRRHVRRAAAARDT